LLPLTAVEVAAARAENDGVMANPPKCKRHIIKLNASVMAIKTETI
jgi:hypothetical protein